MRTARRIRRFVEEELLEGMRLDGDPLARGYLDSLAIEQLILFCEERYGIELVDEDTVAEHFANVGALAALVDRKRKERP